MKTIIQRMAVGASVLTLCACSLLRQASAPPPTFYALDEAGSQTPQLLVASGVSGVSGPRLMPTLIVNPPHAASGFDSQRIIYIRQNHQLAYFAQSEWIDPPAHMLGPLLVTAVNRTGAFGAVVLTPATASGDLRLDTEIVRLQHNFQFSPSRVQLTLRAYLIDDKTRRVLAWREFNAEAVASSETPQGGVAAANAVVHEVLEKLAQFLATRQK